MAKASRGRIFEGYAGFSNGVPVWPTFRADREAAREIVERFNPSVAGYAAPVVVYPVRVEIDLNRQKDMADVWGD